MHRSRFARQTENGWVIGAPLSRDAYVPIRVGEKLTVVMPTDKGLRQFETEVVLRDTETHELTVKIPARMSVVERRQSERIDKFLNPNALIEGKAATLVDLSTGGVRLVTSEPLKRGERAAIDLPDNGRVFGWVLDSAPSSPGYVLRLRFEEPVNAKL
jgi:c-di-GMP-binding flagellar brake protein YcgR